MQEFRTLRDLMLLYEEGAISGGSTAPSEIAVSLSPPSPTEDGGNRKSFKLKSQKFPDLMTCPAIWAFLFESIQTLKKQQWPDLPPLPQPDQKTNSGLDRTTDTCMW